MNFFPFFRAKCWIPHFHNGYTNIFCLTFSENVSTFLFNIFPSFFLPKALAHREAAAGGVPGRTGRRRTDAQCTVAGKG
jgi:hypothetical protein